MVLETNAVPHPPGSGALLKPAEARAAGCRFIGLEINPIYRDAATGVFYPMVLQSLHRMLARTLKQTLFEFVRTHTTHQTPHYHALGRQAMVKAVWHVDRKLAEISDAFDFLLLVTPVNAASAWSAFKRSNFDHQPTFAYRPSPVDPALLKRKLFQIPIERVEYPTLLHLFLEKQRELDVQISMLLERGTPRFLYGSMSLTGGRDDNLRQVAEDVIQRIRPRSRDDSRSGYLDAQAFARRARDEIAYYREMYDAFTASVSIRDDVTAGLMVSHGNLLIGRHTKVPSNRVEALLHHEIGTHALTYFNGHYQPFHQLYVGLAGYEELQEGLAVLSEYLGGNLSRPRLRLLAARVLGVHCLIDGASFVETFRILTTTYNKEFAKEQGGKIVLKPLQGSGGHSVFLVRPDDIPNLNQMIEAVSRDGYVIAQEYLPAAEEGDTRLILMNGEPLRYKGKYAAFRRVRSGGDMRSNIHAGGNAEQAIIGETSLRLADIVRPKLVQDGMFLVGLDIVGDKLMEINVFSPGGLGNAQKFEGVNFALAVIQSLERKVQLMNYYRRNFDNLEMAML